MDEFEDAVSRKDIKKVKMLLVCGKVPKLIDIISEGGTCLHYACILGHYEATKLLLGERGIQLNCQDDCGWTALMYAASQGHNFTVQLLLETGDCDVNIHDTFLQTALHIEVQNRRDSPRLTQMLLNCGANVHMKDADGMTPFLRAIEVDNWMVAKLLVEHGSGVNVCGHTGRSALHFAAINGSEEMVKWLLRIGCNVNAVDNRFQVPLMSSVQQRKPPHLIYRIMQHLIRAGTLINVQDFQGNTTLLLAIGNAGAIKSHHIEMLLMSGANANTPNQDGLSSIWQAVYDGIHYPDRIRIIKLLISQNCYLDMSCRGKLLFTSGMDSVYCYENSMTPLEVALDSGFYEAARLLVMAGCCIKPDLHQETLSVDGPPEISWFRNALVTPGLLQHQCRLVIRRILGQSIHKKVFHLPLPERVKGYVLLRDVL